MYEHGTILSAAYTHAEMPSDDELRLDLLEALRLYHTLLDDGGWAADDQIVSEAAVDLGTVPLVQAKNYRRHRQIERNPAHSKRVKQLQGTKCKGCDRDPQDIYGPVATGLVDAHHLRPLSTLTDGERVKFDPVLDFAVLCPNCHRVIHRLEDAGDLDALRRLIATANPGTT